MKKYIKISSKGELDPKAFTLLGASSKRGNQEMIGQWGSGLKYAIAYLLRNNLEFKIFSGYREIVITKSPETFREGNFDRIVVNGELTSMTTQMGFDWQPWYAIREIYCNAIDEGDYTIEEVNRPEPIEDYSAYYIEINKDLRELLDNWDFYFSDKRTDLLYESTKVKLYQAPNSNNHERGSLVYRKGIRCFKSSVRSLFHYDVKEADINESRELSSAWEFFRNVSNFLAPINDRSVIRYILNNISEAYEGDAYWYSSTFNKSWEEEIGEATLIPYETYGFWKEDFEGVEHIVLPNDLLQALKRQFPNLKVAGNESLSTSFKEVNVLTEKQSMLLQSSMDFLHQANYDVQGGVYVVKFQNEKMLGLAKDKNIYISDKLFDMGKREIIATIIEESEHNLTLASDKTRSFQNQLINRIIVAYELATKTYL